jgi:hypothetical protein
MILATLTKTKMPKLLPALPPLDTSEECLTSLVSELPAHHAGTSLRPTDPLLATTTLPLALAHGVALSTAPRSRPPGGPWSTSVPHSPKYKEFWIDRFPCHLTQFFSVLWYLCSRWAWVVVLVCGIYCLIWWLSWVYDLAFVSITVRTERHRLYSICSIYSSSIFLLSLIRIEL